MGRVIMLSRQKRPPAFPPLRGSKLDLDMGELSFPDLSSDLGLDFTGTSAVTALAEEEILPRGPLDSSVFPLLLPLLRALQWGDSMLPVGGFAFSAGLESAVQCGIVHNAEDLKKFTRTALLQAARGDAVAVACALKSALFQDSFDLMDMDHAVLARKNGEENRLMSTRMGKKLAEMTIQITPTDFMRGWLLRIKEGTTPGTWPVTQGIALAHLGLGEQTAVAVHQYGLAMTILNASLRLMRVTHVDTQRILFELMTEIPGQCQNAAATPWRHMASFAPMNDILAAHHTSTHVRLFMN